MAGRKPEDEGTRARKRRAVLDAATALFLERGFDGTSMDELAAVAGVSKQTIYKQFTDKESLFAQVVLRGSEGSDRFTATAVAALGSAVDVEAQLEALARSYVQVLRLPHVLQLRRLLIGESTRFPELARGYYERVPQRVMAELAAALAALAGRGLLRIEDAELAASHLAFLIIGPMLDRAMFGVAEEADQEARAIAGARAFWRTYRLP